MARIDTHFEAFIEERRAAGLRPTGESQFREAWTAFRQLPGSCRPTLETVRQLRYQQDKEGKIMGAKWQRLLRPVFGWMQDEHLIARFALPDPWTPRRVEGRPAMTRVEVKALLKAVPDPGVRVLAHLVYATGLRVKYLLPLQEGHVDWSQNVLTFPDEPHLHPVYLDPETASILHGWRRKPRRCAPLLFHDRSGQPLTPRTASLALREAGQRVGRPAIGFGHLQYGHTLLLAQSRMDFKTSVLEFQMQQPFRLRYLNIPNIYEGLVISRPDHLRNLLGLLEGEDL